MTDRRLTIILASYNDKRITRAIQSVRRFDDIDTVKILVVDGGSSEDVRELIRGALIPDDIFICEPDRGIFDALNKGLARCDTEFIGWLGSDDMFTGRVPASEVVAGLAQHDLFIANLAFFTGDTVTRITHGLPSRLGLCRYGLHNPHYATFGRASLLKSERFVVDLRTSDQDYFLRIFAKRPRIAGVGELSTLQEEGGFSSRSRLTIVSLNAELVQVFSRHTNWLLGPIAVAAKISYKLIMRMYCSVFRKRITDVIRF